MTNRESVNLNDSFDMEKFFILQDIMASVKTICVITDSTYRSINEMHNWGYANKDEMKYLGGTIIEMEEKFFEYSILGISKMIEDFLNNLKEFANIELKIWDDTLNNCMFVKEIRLIRSLGNVIKHHNSIVKYDGKDDHQRLCKEYGIEDDTQVSWLDIAKESKRDEIFKLLYKAYYFCYQVLQDRGIFSSKQSLIKEDEIVDFMLEFYVHSVPGYPNKVQSIHERS
jgi:hypothetical protein